jgi:uncharacterized damage-inducible protein DinB
MNTFTDQYALVKGTREALFTYCESIPYEDYTHRLDEFAGASMQYLLIHVAYCYRNWIGVQGLQLSEFKSAIHNANEIRLVFREIDTLVERFIDKYQDRWNVPLIVEIPFQDELEPRTPLYMFTHTITHEFHHKGQIVSIGRHLGHIPPVTDLMG